MFARNKRQPKKKVHLKKEIVAQKSHDIMWMFTKINITSCCHNISQDPGAKRNENDFLNVQKRKKKSQQKKISKYFFFGISLEFRLQNDV